MSNLIDIDILRLGEFNGVFENSCVLGLDELTLKFSDPQFKKSLLSRDKTFRYLVTASRLDSINIPRLFFRFSDSLGLGFAKYLESANKNRLSSQSFRPLEMLANFRAYYFMWKRDSGKYSKGGEEIETPKVMEFWLNLCGFIIYWDTDDAGISKHYVRYIEKPIYTSLSPKEIMFLYDYAGDEDALISGLNTDAHYVGFQGVLNRAYTSLFDHLLTFKRGKTKMHNNPIMVRYSTALNPIKKSFIVSQNAPPPKTIIQETITTNEINYESLPEFPSIQT